MTPRRLVFGGAVVTLVGAAIAATAPVIGTTATDRIHAQQTVGGLAVIAGWAEVIQSLRSTTTPVSAASVGVRAAA